MGSRNKVDSALRRDFGRYGRGGRLTRVVGVLRSHGAWAMVGYRFSRWAHRCSLPAALRLPVVALAEVVQVASRTLTNVDLPWGAEVGPGLYIPHTGYVVVASHAVLGENVTLTPGVVLGHGLGGSAGGGGAPRLGDRVYVGPGAILIGPVSIGDDALVAPGSVVTRDVPPRGVVVGNPARLVSRAGAFEVLHYPGMDHDPARLASKSKVGPDDGEEADAD